MILNCIRNLVENRSQVEGVVNLQQAPTYRSGENDS